MATPYPEPTTADTHRIRRCPEWAEELARWPEHRRAEHARRAEEELARWPGQGAGAAMRAYLRMRRED